MVEITKYRVDSEEEGQAHVQEAYDGISEENKAEISLTDSRKEICNVCESKRQYFSLDLCSECGCFIKLKTALKRATCPLDKW